MKWPNLHKVFIVVQNAQRRVIHSNGRLIDLGSLTYNS
jgi:hypothetical protein